MSFSILIHDEVTFQLERRAKAFWIFNSEFKLNSMHAFWMHATIFNFQFELSSFEKKSSSLFLASQTRAQEAHFLLKTWQFLSRFSVSAQQDQKIRMNLLKH